MKIKQHNQFTLPYKNIMGTEMEKVGTRNISNYLK